MNRSDWPGLGHKTKVSGARCVNQVGISSRADLPGQPAQRGRGQGANDDSFSHGDEAQVVVAGMGSPGREGLLYIEAFSLGHHPLGLFGDDAAVEGALELLVYDRTDINAMEA